MKTFKVKTEQVVSDLKALFGVEENGKIDENNMSHVSGNIFYIDKRKFERLMVICMLETYFKDKVIDGGYLKVDNITLVYTEFEVCTGNPY